jgi:hypothetical protein
MSFSHASLLPGGASGFNIISEMIRVVCCTNNQHQSSLELDQLARSISLALINASENLKSSYTCSLDKRAKVGSVDPTPTKHWGVVTPLLIVGTITMPRSGMMPRAVSTPHSRTILHSAMTLRSATMPHLATTPRLAATSHARFTMPIALRPIIMTPSSMLPRSAMAHIAMRPIFMTPSSMSPRSPTCIMMGAYDAILIDQDIVTQHMSHRPSVLLPIYKHISPDDIVCLDPGDELIVVIPPIGKNTTDPGCKVLRMNNKKFRNVIKQTCSNIHPADRLSLFFDRLCSHHYLPWDGQMSM